MALLEHLGDRKKKMINKWDDYTNRMTPLHYAARYNHFRIVELLVQNGASKSFLKETVTPPYSCMEPFYLIIIIIIATNLNECMNGNKFFLLMKFPYDSVISVIKIS